MTIGTGDERVELLYFGPARTPSDIFLWLPKEKILFTGDAINKSVQPIHYDYPNIKQWTAAMQSAMELGAALYLAGHGTPFKTDTVREIIDYYNDLRKGVHPLDGRSRGNDTPQEINFFISLSFKSPDL